MSDTVNPTQAKRVQETEYRDHLIKMKKLKSEFDNKYNTTVKTNNNLLLRLQKDYDVELGNLKNQTERNTLYLWTKVGITLKIGFLC